jgi:hypothetical protein
MKKQILIAAVIVLLALPAAAQLATPRLSQHASVSQTIGTTDITIDYHRPGVKQRAVWGGLVPFDQPWRMGANEATTITFSRDVKVEGQPVPAGKYSFFAIPGRDQWTLVINKDPNQWGAYGYDQSKDQLRTTVKPVKAAHTEWMRFTIDPLTPSTAVINLNWETLQLPVRVEVDVNRDVWADIDAAMKKMSADRAQTLNAAAGWALESGQRLEEGLAWANESIAIQDGVFNNWTKARLLHKLGRAKEAVPVMEKTLTMARAGNMPADFMGILDGTMKAIRADVK